MCPQAGKKGMTSARLSELYQKVLREALDMVSRVQCRGACPSHTVTFCRPCPYPPSGGKCLVGRAERAQCVSPAPARRQGGLSVTSVLGRGEIGRLATAGAAVVPITTSLSLGTSSRFRDEPAHPPDGCISASKAAPHIWLKLAACARVSIEGGPAYMAQAGWRRQPKWSAISQNTLEPATQST